MSSSSTDAKQWTVKFDMSETELMQNIITNLLEILCSCSEYITQDDLNALRSARENYVDREVNMDALLAEISVVREDCEERMNRMGKMDRVKEAESSLMKAIEDIRKKMEDCPVSAKDSLSLACDEKQKLLRSIANQRQHRHSKDEEDDAYTRISSLLEHERQALTKYLTYVKTDPKPNNLDYSAFAADPTVLDSMGADRPLHLHYDTDIEHLTDKPRRFHLFDPDECDKYLCPFQTRPHFHECKLSDCRRLHFYPCSNRECGQRHDHIFLRNDKHVMVICHDKQCDKYPNILKFGDLICVQPKPSEARK